jgi:hypothetical protein
MGMDFYILIVIFDSKLRNATFAFETDSRMQKNFAVEYQTTFFRKLHSSTLEWKLKENFVYNYLDVLNLVCSDQLIMIATVIQTLSFLIL